MKAESRRPHLVFVLGGEGYAVAIEDVRELVSAVPLTPVPGAPPWMRGIFNLRGAVVPLVDLGVKLGVGTAAPTLRTAWVVVELVVERHRHVLAFEADEVVDLVELDEGELLATPPAGLRVKRECVRGVIPSGEGFGLVLDLERVLTADELLAGSDGAPT